jgi:hypothetical protein
VRPLVFFPSSPSHSAYCSPSVNCRPSFIDNSSLATPFTPPPPHNQFEIASRSISS